MKPKAAPGQALGLYIHIPFCDRLCHYCDFVKTAWHAPEEQKAYIEALVRRFHGFLACPEFQNAKEIGFSSVFFGGGTPSVLDSAYEPLLEAIRPFLHDSAEMSLEANPEHVTGDRVKCWRDLGINRLSLGVQSLQEAGLRFLTRSHSPEIALQAIETARKFISNVNVDLIYAWPDQSLDQWLQDIEGTLAQGATHLSLYSLTFEGRTPLARRVQRGVLDPMAEEKQDSLFQAAREKLEEARWLHEEVSNWALPGHETFHNAIYWTGGGYLGLGAGAHSYVPFLGPWGLRFHQSGNWKKFLKEAPSEGKGELLDFLKQYQYEVEADRGAEAWIIEMVSSGLRTTYGINKDAICAKTGYSWAPRPVIKKAFEDGILVELPGGWCHLVPQEWYRETRWSLELAMSFVP
jgi:oxygen-independent coproporphyrinogen-3 oxidase